MANIRRRATTIAVKLETTPGVDAFGGSPPAAATDFLKADVDVAFNQTQVPNPELNGALDNSAPLTGGTKCQITLTCMIKGSGAAGVAPQWGKLMKLCAYQEVVTAAAITAQAATAGTAQTATLGAGYTATAELYQGMPVIITGNPAGPFNTLIGDYTASKVATFAHLFNPVLSTSSLVAIPANVLYKPVTDPSLINNGTVVIFMDGLMHKFTGCAGTWTLDMTAAQAGTLKFTLTGQYNAPIAASAPSGIVFDAVQPPTFRQGIARLNGALVRVNKATFDAGNTLYEPDNPEAPEGFDPSIITVRDSKGSFDPLSSVTDTIARMAAFKAGGQQIAAVGMGTVAGNMIGVIAPTAQYTGVSPTNRSDLIAETLPFECNGPNSGIFVSVA